MKIQQVFGAAIVGTIMFSHQLLAKDISDTSDPVPVTIKDSEVHVEYRYIGVTSYESEGSFFFQSLTGIPAMDNACEVEFGAGARAANIAEALHSDVIFGEPTDSAWLVPSGPMTILIDPDVSIPSQGLVFDSQSGVIINSGQIAGGLLMETTYCHQYKDTLLGTLGVVVTNHSYIRLGNCYEVHPVACSAPVVIPVR